MPNRRDLFKHVPGGLGAIAIGTGMLTKTNETQVQEEGPRHFALLVLDRSGSMAPRQKDVIDGVNEFLNVQANNTGMLIGIVQFDSYANNQDQYCESILNWCPANQTPRLNISDYQPRGGTPLLAAIVESIASVEKMIRPIDRVLINIQTDGYENSSPSEITREVVRSLIKAKEAEGNWTFAFMGADIDAWGESSAVGFAHGSTLQYAGTSSGTQAAYNNLSNSANIWYNNTGGGQSYDVALASPANSNSNFYENTISSESQDVLVTWKQSLEELKAKKANESSAT